MSREEQRKSYAAAAGEALAALREVPGIDFADVRVAREERRSVSMRNRELDDLSSGESAGVGVRVLRDGAWGFASRPDITAASAAEAARRAAEIAGEVARAQTERVRLCEEEPVTGQYETPVEIDPFEVPLEQVVADLDQAIEILLGGRAPAGPIQAATAQTSFRRELKYYLNTEGTSTWQATCFGGAGIKVVAADEGAGAVQRTWPIDHDGGLAAGGYEAVRALELPRHAERIREECLALLVAPPCPAGRRTLVLDTPQLAIQIHES